ncbi:MAG TPA: response regulator [Anaeromyxobacteraceae bacterium]|jgi:DNA-binding NtrC family response regulator|nr:response regulator [Anaeromyxobacteraceae bacterium]
MQNAAEKKPFRVLVLDAEPALLTALEALLRRKGFEVTAATSVAAASRFLDEGELDVALLDLGLRDGDGGDLLAALKERQPDVEVVAVAGAAGRAALRAVEAGAYDCLVKPLEDEERVALAVQRAAERRRLLARARWLEGRLVEREGGAGEALAGDVTGTEVVAPRPVPAANGEDPGWLGQSYAAAKEDALRRFESAYVERLMRECRDNISAAARKAGMDRSNFKRVLRKYRGELKDGDEAPRAPRSASA